MTWAIGMIKHRTQLALVIVITALLVIVVADHLSAEPSYHTCTEFKAMGIYNNPKGSPNYFPRSDRDKDGVACEL